MDGLSLESIKKLVQAMCGGCSKCPRSFCTGGKYVYVEGQETDTPNLFKRNGSAGFRPNKYTAIRYISFSDFGKCLITNLQQNILPILPEV